MNKQVQQPIKEKAHNIVVTPEMERKKPPFLLEPVQEPASAPASSQKGKSAMGSSTEQPMTYSPFMKRRGDSIIASPRNSVQFDIASDKEKDAEIAFFFDNEGGGRSKWSRIRKFFSSRFFDDDDEPHDNKNKNAKQRAIEQRTAKTFFANERTLLSWMNTATFLSLAGITMMNTQTPFGKVAGVALTVITICFALYALWKYMQRLYGLKGKTVSARLDDRIGPPLLILSFCIVLIILGVYFLVTPAAP